MEEAVDISNGKIVSALDVDYGQEKKFKCDLCGEYVIFAHGEIKKSYFRHYKQKDIEECDKRQKAGITNYKSIEQKIGLSLYLSNENFNESSLKNEFKLSVLFKPIPEKILEEVSNDFYIAISGYESDDNIDRLLVNQRNFSSNKIIPIEYICREYKIKYSSNNNIAEKLKCKWGEIIEGLIDDRGIFRKDNGRKIRCKNYEKIFIDTPYYIVVRQHDIKDIENIVGKGLDIKHIGVIKSTKGNLEYMYVYEIIINENSCFDTLSKNFHIIVWRKEDEIIHLWPPLIVNDEDCECIFDYPIYSYKKDGQKIYYDNKERQKEESIDNIIFNNRLNEKLLYNITPISFKLWNNNYKSFDFSYNIKVDQKEFVENECNCIPKKIEVEANSKIRVLLKKKNSKFNIYPDSNSKKENIIFDKINNEDELLIYYSNELIHSVLFKKIYDMQPIFFDLDYLKKLENSEKVITPDWIEKLIIEVKNTDKIYEILNDYKKTKQIPIKVKSYLKNVLKGELQNE